MTSEEVRAAFVWQTMEVMGRVWTDDHCAYTTRQMADEIVRLREQLRDTHTQVFHLGEKLSVVDQEREQAYEVAQQNEATARRMADRIRDLEAQMTLPPIREKFVRVSDELVAELKAAPSKPVTVAIVEDGNELHMTFTEAQP